MSRRYRRTVLALCAAALFVTVYGRLAISPVVPDVVETYDVTTGRVGVALTGMWIAYALTQYPSGVIADTFGDRPVIVVSVAGTGVAAALVLSAPGFLTFALGTFLLGGVAGLHYSVGTTLLDRIYDDVGMAIGVHNSGATIAGVLTPVLVASVAVRFGWRAAVGTTVLVAVPVAVLVQRVVREPDPRYPDRRMRDGFEWDAVRSLLSRPDVLFTALIAIIADFTWQTAASFLPAFFVEYHGLSGTVAGTLFAAYFVAQGVLQVGVGVATDRFGHDPTIAVCMVAGIAGISALVGGSGLAWMTVGVVLLGGGMGFGPAVFPRFMELLSENERGYGFGAFRTFYMLFAASGPAIVGLLTDAYGWRVSFGFLTVLLALVVVLLGGNRLAGDRY